MVQIGKCESSFFLHLVILTQGKKCDTCVCKEANNGTYLSSEWLNERMIVKHRSLCIYISFEKNVERHIAKRVKKLKKKNHLPTRLTLYDNHIFFLRFFKQKKFIYNEPTLNTLLLIYSKIDPFVRCDFPNLNEILNDCWVKRNVERRCIRNAKIRACGSENIVRTKLARTTKELHGQYSLHRKELTQKNCCC